MKKLVLISLFLLQACFQQEKTVESNARIPSSNLISSCTSAIRLFLNRSQGREYSFFRFNAARAELDKLIKENNLNLPQLIHDNQLIDKMKELNFLNSAEEKVALFDKILPLEKFTRISDFSTLTPGQTKQINEMMENLSSWKFEDNIGINRIELDQYITHLYLMGRENPKGLLGFWYKIYGNPNDIIYKWYLDTLYRDGMTGLMGKFYQGKTNITRMADFRAKGLRLIAGGFKSVASLAAVGLDLIPLGNMSKINIPAEKMERWLSLPYNQIADEMNQELRLRANLNFSKRLVSRLFVLAGVSSMGYLTYTHFSRDTFDKNSELLDFEIQMMANELARYMSQEERAKEEILAVLEPQEREDATMVETATNQWIEQQSRFIAETMNKTEIEREWNNYLREIEQ